MLASRTDARGGWSACPVFRCVRLFRRSAGRGTLVGAVVHARQRVPGPGSTQGGRARCAACPRGGGLWRRDLPRRRCRTHGRSQRRVHAVGRADGPRRADGLHRSERADATDRRAIRHARVGEPARDAIADASPEADAGAQSPPHAGPDAAPDTPRHGDAGAHATDAAEPTGSTRLANQRHGVADLRHGRSRR